MKCYLNRTISKAIVACLLSFCASIGYSQTLTVSQINPTDKTANDGQIIIHGLLAGTPYNVTYDQNDTTIAVPLSITSDVNGNIVIIRLVAGKYSNFQIATTGAPVVAQHIITTTTLIGKTIASQATKFVGAVYGNFTGVQDDNPNGFVQTYARLSQPLNKYDGISVNSHFKDRWIPVRNFIVQLTYGNTDNFKTYSVDTLGDKYTNRLDLLAHSYFNGNIALNLVTFVVPENWRKHQGKGDLGHVYFDIFTSFLVTKVTDTLLANDPATVKLYNVKSSVVGLNLKAAFNSTDWNIEASFKPFIILPWSSYLNHNMNVQSGDYSSGSLAQNATKPFSLSKNPVYFQFDVDIHYLTGKQPSNSGGNVTSNTSNSNAFIRFSHITNMRNNSGNHYPNNYWLLQLGYALDITKLLNG